jgi:hypothetical protein
MSYSREEIQVAFDRYRDAAEAAGRSGDWQPWVDCFVPDLEYVEHLFGTFRGRDAVRDWIESTMRKWPFTEMITYPWDWYTIDAEQGFVVGQVQNRFSDPGDGEIYQSANWTRLVYASDGLFASEEDVYNPSEFAPVVEGWLAAWRTHHPDQPDGPPAG